MMGMDLGVVLRRCLVIAYPMPREAGVTRIQAMFETFTHEIEAFETGLLHAWPDRFARYAPINHGYEFVFLLFMRCCLRTLNAPPRTISTY